VGLGREMSTFYFSSSGGTGTHSTKSASGHIMPTLCFLYPVGSAGLVVHFGASGARNVNALFFILWSARCSFHKKSTRKLYVELVFLHLVGSTCHVVHSSVSET
jgi:hypothetical protein